jgi:flavin reductase (DIM6/NTAB) family NADH-FMN oxidoreductase RutF
MKIQEPDQTSADALATIASSLDPALIVVTAAAGSERGGCLVGFHAQSSIDPPRYSVWLSKANHTYRIALRSTHLGIHFLSEQDMEWAELFGTHTGDEIDKFAHLNVRSGPGRIPVLSDCPHRLTARITALLDERGDHLCIATELVDATDGGPFSPLRLSHAAHLDPGHGNEERNSPPTERAAG